MQENNFKAVLESIRDLMNEETIIPDWLTNIFLGYGDPAGAQYTSIIEEQPEVFISKVDFKDTFLDSQHLIESFPGQRPHLCLSWGLRHFSFPMILGLLSCESQCHQSVLEDQYLEESQVENKDTQEPDHNTEKRLRINRQHFLCIWARFNSLTGRAEYNVEIVNKSGNPKATRPFRISFPPPAKQEAEQKGKKRKAGEEPGSESQPVTSKAKLVAESYAPQDPGPYPQDKPPENPVRFTPVQVCIPSVCPYHNLWYSTFHA